MDPRTEPVCVCGHMEGYHVGVTHEVNSPGLRVIHRCCAGYFKQKDRACDCPRFRLALYPSHVEDVENSDRP